MTSTEWLLSEDPPERETLTEAAAGRPFDAARKQAWPRSSGSPTTHRQELKKPVSGDSRVRDAFRRAYEGVADPGAASVVALAGMWEEMQPALSPDPVGM